MTPRANSTQGSLFRREIPRVPEGYYSSGPNPNLRRFVEEHAKPYDPATDDYDAPPFDQPITTTKATAIYNMHTYWSKKPHDAIRQYISHYTKPGDIVLDPFCGSGGTALAALMEGRAAIAIDLSPAATFITKIYCTPVDVDELQRAFEELQRKVKPEMDWLYETRCDRCDGRATIQYTVYSQVYQCSRCLKRFPLSECPEHESLTAKGDSKTIRVCPHCYELGQVEEIRSQSQKSEAIPIRVSYLCEEGCRPQRSGRRYNDPDPKKRAFFEQYDLERLKQVQADHIPYWVPPQVFPQNFARWKSDLRLSGITSVAGLYTTRNLWALAAVRHHLDAMCSPEANSDSAALWGAITTVALTGSRMLRESKRAIQAGTYYIPPISREIKVWTGFQYNVSQMLKGLGELAGQATDPWDVCVSTQSACDLKQIPADSIDYIFTDPPYAGKVQYGELNFAWEAWLGFDTGWHDGEIIVNESRGKNEVDWISLMRRALRECYRVLKPSRWISLCYHDTSEGTWQLLQDLMTEVGFIPESSHTTLYIDASQKSYNQRKAEKVTKRDLVINFRKPRPGEVAAEVEIIGDEDAATFAEKARAILVDALEAHPGATSDRLYDELVSRMVRRGEFERHNFEALLAQVAEPVHEPVMRNLFEVRSPDLFGSHEAVRWYLKDTADRADEAESAREAAAAARLEAFMRSRATDTSEGTHYSDLFEQYLGVKDKPRRLLADWMPEYFIKTADGTWRLPVDSAERSGLTALRTTGTLRRIKRFANALLDGVRPAERDRPTNLATAADWLRQCRRAGLYELGRALYEKGGFKFGELGEEREEEAKGDYEVCVRRSR